MRIGLLGPAREEDRRALREAIEFLLGDADVDEAIYLGEDDGVVDRALEDWARELTAGEPSEASFLAQAAEVALSGSADAIEALLHADAWVARLARVRRLPPSPIRAVEMIADRIMLAVYDKSILDEEDIANAQLIVYGKSGEAQLKRFGPRYFLTPGPLGAGRVAVLELENDGQVSLALFETSGLPVWRETMARRTSKMSVVR